MCSVQTTQSVALWGKAVKRLNATEITTCGKTKAEVTENTRFPLRVNGACPSGCTQTTSSPSQQPITHLGILQQRSHVCSWLMGVGGGSLCQPVHLEPPSPSSTPDQAPSAAHCGPFIHLPLGRSSCQTDRSFADALLHRTLMPNQQSIHLCSADDVWLCLPMTQQFLHGFPAEC